MSKQTASFYDWFSFFYPLVDVFLRPQKGVLCREVNALPFGRLLEIGVGHGAHLPLYKTHQITGIDTSANMLKKASQVKGYPVELLHMNGESLGFQEESFDYVVLAHVIAVVDNPEQLLEEAYRVLKPGGRMFILNHVTPNNWLKLLDHSVAVISAMFHFKAVFYVEQLRALRKFSLLKEIGIGSVGYFKLLIYRKQ